ncbi:DUF2750 domain-containing protein [Streptomyces sp. ms184]|uniref:DUF2750 domain-containing protein n=1 Tax=Streptomyces sp. ms184 TaxID=1827974 RepID=UPI000BF2280A|nr:DUF2750 domain-containing protein [Streptomyces sp. ms184]
MSQSGSQAAAFFREACRSGTVWFVRDEEGSPAPLSADGTRSLPYWSTKARAQRAAKIWGHGLYADSMAHWATAQGAQRGRGTGAASATVPPSA